MGWKLDKMALIKGELTYERVTFTPEEEERRLKRRREVRRVRRYDRKREKLRLQGKL
jgi:hypothetical protein